jgi:SulP family sulfate permease
MRRVWPRSPHLLLGMIAGMLGAAALTRWAQGWPPVEVVGVVPQAWPHWQPPEVNWRQLPELTGLAIALTIIALGQSYSIAKVLSQRSGQYIDANREFLGQGLSNIVGGLFSCFLSCGSLNRSLPLVSVHGHRWLKCSRRCGWWRWWR